MLHVTIIRTSDKAVLVEIPPNDDELWIPKSCCKHGEQFLDELDPGDEIELAITDWFANDHGL